MHTMLKVYIASKVLCARESSIIPRAPQYFGLFAVDSHVVCAGSSPFPGGVTPATSHLAALLILKITIANTS